MPPPPPPRSPTPTKDAGRFAGTDHGHRHRGDNGPRPTTSGTALSAAAVAVPGLGAFAAASFLPACLGLWRTGYAVSYGYGGAVMASGLLQLLAVSGTTAAVSLPVRLHAALYVFYGLRLNSFLLHREIVFPVAVHMMKRRDDSLPKRLKRLPVITGCSFLYFCMAAGPMRILATVDPPATGPVLATLAAGFAGFVLAGIGDWYKARIKARDGPNKLVVTGPFRYLRHPNYTGDMLGWTCACLLPALLLLLSGAGGAGGGLLRSLPWVLASVVGWSGIVFAVYGSEATAGLERKHREKYGGTPEYEDWIRRSWAGPVVVAGGSDSH